MLAKIQKWGNNQGLRIAKNLLADAQLIDGDQVDISVKEGIMIVAPAKRIRGRYSLKDLVSRIPESYKPDKVDWGEPQTDDINMICCHSGQLDDTLCRSAGRCSAGCRRQAYSYSPTYNC